MSAHFTAMGNFVESELQRAQNESVFDDSGVSVEDVIERANRFVEGQYGVQGTVERNHGNIFEQ